MIVPKDIHGRELREGDWIGWAHTQGSSRMKRTAALTTGRIAKINFSHYPLGHRGCAIRCDQHRATKYTLLIDAGATTGPGVSRQRVIVNIKNVVKLEPVEP